MGGTVNKVVAPVSQAVSQVVKGAESVVEGDVAKGLGQIGEGTVNYGKSLYGISADNKVVGIDALKTGYGEFKEDPVGAVKTLYTGYVTGGASLVGAAVQAGQSQLSAALKGSPSDLASGGGAAVLPAENRPIYSGPVSQDFTGPVAVGAALLGAYILIKRK